MLALLALLAVEVSVVSASHSAGNTMHVSVRVANDGDAPYALSDARLALLDSTGRRFAAQEVIDEIPAGESQQIDVLFFVPAGLRGALFVEAAGLDGATAMVRIPDARESARPKKKTRQLSGEIPLGPLLQGLTCR